MIKNLFDELAKVAMRVLKPGDEACWRVAFGTDL